uniref:Chromo domain-containing protein n=1 Tax=Mycena chlorophos TaxID=658473 RepID=A0ABQ0L1E3_MYCCL|nr:predicted protein [Mycena chlorophos]
MRSKIDARMYGVDSIGRATIGRSSVSGKYEWLYLIKWTGYPWTQRTWEPQCAFNDLTLIETFWANANLAGRNWKKVCEFRVGDTVDITDPPRTFFLPSCPEHSSFFQGYAPLPARGLFNFSLYEVSSMRRSSPGLLVPHDLLRDIEVEREEMEDVSLLDARARCLQDLGNKALALAGMVSRLTEHALAGLEPSQRRGDVDFAQYDVDKMRRYSSGVVVPRALLCNLRTELTYITDVPLTAASRLRLENVENCIVDLHNIVYLVVLIRKALQRRQKTACILLQYSIQDL